MKKFAIGLLALMFVLASSASATIRYVSASGAGAFTTITAAANAAVSGDTILIGPGNYTDGNINVSNKRLTYIGAGWDQTIISLSAVWYANTSGQNGTSWEGMQVNGSSQMFFIANSADSISFRRCLIGGTATSQRLIDGQAGRNLTLEDCILLGNLTSTGAPMIDITTGNYPTTVRNCVFVNRGGHASCRAIGGAATSGTVEVYNSVFLNFATVLALSAAGGPVIAVNNIFYDWLASPSFGSYNTGASVWDHNSSTASPAAPGTNTTVIAANPFVNYNTTNNYGPWQFPEKLIPLVALNALEGKPLPVYGDGSNIRDWIHVEDHAEALVLALQRGQPGATYCLGPRQERTNLEVVQAICATLDRLRPDPAGPRARLITFVKDRPGHDFRYAMDPSGAERALGWKAKRDFEAGLDETLRWYLANEAWWRPIRARHYAGQRLGTAAA